MYEDVVDAIVGRLFPLLEDHPRAGRDWLRQPPPTESGQLLVLYAIDAKVVTLLAVRHHRQSGFDLA